MIELREGPFTMEDLAEWFGVEDIDRVRYNRNMLYAILAKFCMFRVTDDFRTFDYVEPKMEILELYEGRSRVWHADADLKLRKRPKKPNVFKNKILTNEETDSLWKENQTVDDEIKKSVMFRRGKEKIGNNYTQSLQEVDTYQRIGARVKEKWNLVIQDKTAAAYARENTYEFFGYPNDTIGGSFGYCEWVLCKPDGNNLRLLTDEEMERVKSVRTGRMALRDIQSGHVAPVQKLLEGAFPGEQIQAGIWFHRR